ncbi:hypothetical protein ACTXT7_009244 [Hymenolepis weldensis]
MGTDLGNSRSNLLKRKPVYCYECECERLTGFIHPRTTSNLTFDETVLNLSDLLSGKSSKNTITQNRISVVTGMNQHLSGEHSYVNGIGGISIESVFQNVSRNSPSECWLCNNRHFARFWPYKSPIWDLYSNRRYKEIRSRMKSQSERQHMTWKVKRGSALIPSSVVAKNASGGILQFEGDQRM